MKLYSEPLSDFSELGHQGIFKATLNAHGLYNTFQFVLRLSPAVHRKLASMPSGIVSSDRVDLAGMRAFSIYLHETVHWWQHIGSTYGLMMSMTYPAQAHANNVHLKGLVAQIGFKKSIRTLAETLPGDGADTPGGLANIIVNNHFDMESFRALTVNPFSAEKLVRNPLFESVGHSYDIAYGNFIALMSSVSDRAFRIIPPPEAWCEPFRELREKKVEGYYYGSPVTLHPVGAHEIFEGQARMAQLQYLHFATGGQLDMKVAKDERMLNGVYGDAFYRFLELSELEEPSSIDHPTIALFLLICDIAINPGSGFPFPLVRYETFIHDINPGTRFVYLCTVARLKCPEVRDSIRHYSRKEYEEVSQTLCDAIVEESPLQIAKEFSQWIKEPEFQPLMAEHESFRFQKSNLAARVLFSHFLDFTLDKGKRPEFFCWPGAWMAGDRASNDAMKLFERHSALFVDKEDDDGIFPRLVSGRIESDVQETFDYFYANNIIFDLTRQWITEPGPFKFRYQWLSQKDSSEDMQRFAERSFESAYGVVLSKVSVLNE